MPETLFKQVDYTLSKLLHDIDHGEIGLPDIQRPFVWDATKVRDLFDSMYKGFPVGYLLFWANDHVSNTRHIGTESHQVPPRLLIIDGQQRLTALYAVVREKKILTNDFVERDLHIAFNPITKEFKVADAAVKKDPEYIPNISQLWSREIAFRRVANEFVERLRESRDVSEDQIDDIYEAIDRVRDLENYPFTALEVSPSVDEENVAEIFVRINSKGVQLKQSDFILTLLSVYWEQGRKDLEQFCRDALKPAETSKANSFNHFITPKPDQLLRPIVAHGFRRARFKYVYQLLRGRDLESKVTTPEQRAKQFEIFKNSQSLALNLTTWSEFFKAIIRAGYRRENMIASETGLLYTYALYLIGKEDFKVDDFDLRNIIAQWFFMAALTSRYSSSSESTMEEDLSSFRDLTSAQDFVGQLKRIISSTLTEDFWSITLPETVLVTSKIDAPGFQAYKAALNILDAKVLFSQLSVRELLDPALTSKKAATEHHHLFPKNYLKNKGINSVRDTNQVANYTLVEWGDNIDISDKSPEDYFPELSKRYSSEELAQIMNWHALPNNWWQLEYPEFLDQRRKLMAKVIKDAFSKVQGTRDE